MSIRSLAWLAALVPLTAVAQESDASLAAKVDKVLASSATTTAPGCAVGVARGTQPPVERAFGMADLELGVPNTPASIFESGSVAKQFTAASIVTLAIEGKLRLDDPVRKYITELPEYGAPLTIRHLLNHTSGVRDWGSVLELTGFGRGDRVVSQALAMDVTTHQKGVDFVPGAEYSYSNSGYTLLSTIVERVSGKSLPVFTAERFFRPLGMTHTQWRDDYRRLVPGRAQAYSPIPGGWRLDMPFMNVYGNGGILTTVGDFLKWNAMLASRSFGKALVDSMERRGRLNNGREITYALGLVVDRYKGRRQVGHSGGTAGYVTYLTRFPDDSLSIAVICNGASMNPIGLALRIADEALGLPAAPAADTISVSAGQLGQRVALWRGTQTHLPAQTVVENGVLRIAGGPVLHPLRDGSFLAGQGPVRWEFTLGANGKPARAARRSVDGDDEWVAESPWTPTVGDLTQFSGDWWSPEAGATFTFVVENGTPLLRQRPDRTIPLRPVYRDHFGLQTGGGLVVWFTRNATGHVIAMHIGASRMRDMPFSRVASHGQP